MPNAHYDLDDERSLRQTDRAVRLAVEWFELNLALLQRECPGGYALIDGETKNYVTADSEEEAEQKFRRLYPDNLDAVHFRIIQK